MGKIFDALKKSRMESDGGEGRSAPKGDGAAIPLGAVAPGVSAADDAAGGQDHGAGGAGATAGPAGESEGPHRGGGRRTLEMDPNLVTLFRQQTVEAEQFRMLKTKILFPEQGRPPRSIMVTSALPGEGKTFVASNLAISIAQSLDEYVLLMD